MDRVLYVYRVLFFGDVYRYNGTRGCNVLRSCCLLAVPKAECIRHVILVIYSKHCVFIIIVNLNRWNDSCCSWSRCRWGRCRPFWRICRLNRQPLSMFWFVVIVVVVLANYWYTSKDLSFTLNSIFHTLWFSKGIAWFNCSLIRTWKGYRRKMSIQTHIDMIQTYVLHFPTTLQYQCLVEWLWHVSEWET